MDNHARTKPKDIETETQTTEEGGTTTINMGIQMKMNWDITE